MMMIAIIKSFASCGLTLLGLRTESSHDSALEGDGFELPVRGRGELGLSPSSHPNRQCSH
jgi:hypothetical protein